MTTTRLPSFYIKMYVNCLFKTLNLEIMLKNYNGELVSKGNGSNGLLEQMNYTGIIVKLNIIYDYFCKVAVRSVPVKLMET